MVLEIRGGGEDRKETKEKEKKEIRIVFMLGRLSMRGILGSHTFLAPATFHSPCPKAPQTLGTIPASVCQYQAWV